MYASYPYLYVAMYELPVVIFSNIMQNRDNVYSIFLYVTREGLLWLNLEDIRVLPWPVENFVIFYCNFDSLQPGNTIMRPYNV